MGDFLLVTVIAPNKWFCQNSASGQNSIVPHLLRRPVNVLPVLPVFGSSRTWPRGGFNCRLLHEFPALQLLIR